MTLKINEIQKYIKDIARLFLIQELTAAEGIQVLMHMTAHSITVFDLNSPSTLREYAGILNDLADEVEREHAKK